MYVVIIQQALSYPFASGSNEQGFGIHLEPIQHQHPPMEWLRTVHEVGVVLSAEEIQVQRCLQLALG